MNRRGNINRPGPLGLSKTEIRAFNTFDAPTPLPSLPREHELVVRTAPVEPNITLRIIDWLPTYREGSNYDRQTYICR